MHNDSNLKEGFYQLVGQYVASCDCDIKRSLIDLRFPDVEPKKLSKALQNACAKGLIHSVERNVYRGGPKKSKGVFSQRKLTLTEEPADVGAIVTMAMRSRTPIELAWMGGPKTSPASQPSPC